VTSLPHCVTMKGKRVAGAEDDMALVLLLCPCKLEFYQLFSTEMVLLECNYFVYQDITIMQEYSIYIMLNCLS
jgi:hypothetical protein